MKLHLIMHENRDELAHFAYHRSSHPKGVFVTPNPHISEKRITEIATSSIPQAYQDKLQALTEEIRTLIETRRKYLNTAIDDLAPQLQPLIDQYIADHPEELL